MTETVLRAPEVSGSRVTARLSIDGAESELYVDAPDHGVDGNVDGFFCAVLPAAMKAGAPLVVEAPVSPQLLGSVPTIQKIFRRSSRRFVEIDVRAEPRDPTEKDRIPREGIFFSLGIDSFHTLYSKRDEISSLILVEGMDNQRLEPAMWKEMFVDAETVAEHLDKELIRVESNLRDLSFRYGGWRMLYGGALVCVGHQLSHKLGRVHFSAASTFPRLMPHGSQPLLDPLWNTERLDTQNFGWLEPRTSKVRSIAHQPDVMKTLRVCVFATEGLRNCGRCEKCLRTMIALDAVGALKNCETLPDQVPIDLVRKLDLNDPTHLHFAEENLELLEETGANPAVQRALQRALKLRELRALAKAVLPARVTKLIGSSRRTVNRMIGRRPA